MAIPVHQRLITLQYKEELAKLANGNVITLARLFLDNCVLVLATLLLLNLLIYGSGLLEGEIDKAFRSSYEYVDEQLKQGGLFLTRSPLTYSGGVLLFVLMLPLLAGKHLFYFALKNFVKDLVGYACAAVFVVISFTQLLRYFEIDYISQFNTAIAAYSCIVLLVLIVKHRKLFSREGYKTGTSSARRWD